MNYRNCSNIPHNYSIFGSDYYCSRNCFETGLNNNVLVVGSSGTGKTRSVVMPNLYQEQGSLIVSDPKGYLYEIYEAYYKKLGYNVELIDFTNPAISARYNPFKRIRNTADIQKLAHIIVYSSYNKGQSRVDPFWDEASLMLFEALIGYMVESDEIKDEDMNVETLISLIKESNRNEKGTSSRGKSELDKRMERHQCDCIMKGKDSWAFGKYQEYNTAPDKTFATITVTSLAKLSSFSSREVRQLMSGNDINFEKIGQEKTALFVVVSDIDRSLDVLVNIFYTQLIDSLCSYADKECDNHCLPVPVQFVLDDFATNAKIVGFENMISNIRSRGISTMLMIQSEAQLRAGYGDDAQTIIDNCNTYIYMGSQNPDTARLIAKRANKPLRQILNMPVGKSWIFRRGKEPRYVNNFNIEEFRVVREQEVAELVMEGEKNE